MNSLSFIFQKKSYNFSLLWLPLQSPLADVTLFSFYKSKRDIFPLFQLCYAVLSRV